MLSDLVFDVGAHYGNDTAHYLRRGFRVVAVEAHPGLAAALWDRFVPEVRSGRLVIEPVAVGPDHGEVLFYVVERNDAVWSSILPDEARKHGLPVREIRVPSVRFADLLARHGVPYFLKVDIEGADHYCLEALSPVDLPEYVSFEAQWGRLADLFRLNALGYRRFRLADQLYGFTTVSPPPLHSIRHAVRVLQGTGRSCVRALPGFRSTVRGVRKLLTGSPNGRPRSVGSGTRSGPMPDELCSEWQSVEACCYAWLYVAERMRSGARWYDVHATR